MKRLTDGLRILALLSIAVSFAAVLYLYFSIDLITAGLTGLCAFLLISYIAASSRQASQIEKFKSELIEYRHDTDMIIRQIAELKSENQQMRREISDLLTGKLAPFTSQLPHESPDDNNPQNSADSDLTQIENTQSQDIESNDLKSDSDKADVTEMPMVKVANTLLDKAVTSMKETVPGVAEQAGKTISHITTEIHNVTDKTNKTITLAGSPVAYVEQIIEKNEFEIALQSVMQIPQRQVKSYHAVLRVPDDDGILVDINTALPQDGFMPIFKDIMRVNLPLAIAVERRVISEIPGLKMFMPLSAASLMDADWAQEKTALLKAHQGMADDFVFVISQRETERLSAAARAVWASIQELGYRFCINEPAHFRFDGSALSDMGVSYIRTPAEKLFALANTTTGKAQLEDLMERLQIEDIRMIACDVKDEQSILELLDLDIQLAEGTFLSEPRLVNLDGLRPERPISAA